MTLPALTESRPFRLTTVTTMYVAQGIQLGLIDTAFPAYMAAHGVSPVAIGAFLSASTLPWTFKLVYAPLMERYTFLAMGRRRPWILAGTAGGAASYTAMALVPDPLGHLGLLTALMVGGSLLIALQDIATDALTVDVFPPDEHGRANGLMWGGKVLGAAGTIVAAAWLLGTVGVSATFALAGLATLAFAAIPLLVRERPGERLLPWTSGASSPEAQALHLPGWAAIGRGLRRAMLLPASLLGAAIGFLMGVNDGFFDVFGPAFTVQSLGWTDTAFSNTMATAKLAGGVVGMVGGGLLITWLGPTRTLRAALFLAAGVGVAMALSAPLWSTPLVAQAYLLLTAMALTLAVIALFATCMAMCWKPVAAVQFALFMATQNAGYVIGAALTGPAMESLTDAQALLVAGAFSVVAALLLLRVDLAAHGARVEALDANKVRPPAGAVPGAAALRALPIEKDAPL
jgi:PAT family beta-lactamase induction signal transducer AmpG